MKSYLLLILATTIPLSCSSQSLEINGSVWVYKYSPDLSADSLIFKDTLFVSYRAELDMRYYGRYHVQNDTIYFEGVGEIWMYDPPKYVPTEDDKNTKGRAIINKVGKLQYISPLRFENGQWIDTGIEFGEYAIFERLE